MGSMQSKSGRGVRSLCGHFGGGIGQSSMEFMAFEIDLESKDLWKAVCSRTTGSVGCLEHGRCKEKEGRDGKSDLIL